MSECQLPSKPDRFGQGMNIHFTYKNVHILTQIWIFLKTLTSDCQATLLFLKLKKNNNNKLKSVSKNSSIIRNNLVLCQQKWTEFPSINTT